MPTHPPSTTRHPRPTAHYPPPTSVGSTRSIRAVGWRPRIWRGRRPVEARPEAGGTRTEGGGGGVTAAESPAAMSAAAPGISGLQSKSTGHADHPHLTSANRRDARTTGPSSFTFRFPAATSEFRGAGAPVLPGTAFSRKISAAQALAARGSALPYAHGSSAARKPTWPLSISLSLSLVHECRAFLHF